MSCGSSKPRGGFEIATTHFHQQSQRDTASRSKCQSTTNGVISGQKLISNERCSADYLSTGIVDTNEIQTVSLWSDNESQLEMQSFAGNLYTQGSARRLT
jgi:hypothetical protein